MNSLRLTKTSRYLCVFIVWSLFFSAAITSDNNDIKYVLSREGFKPRPFVAIDNVCAWPNLTVLRDGTIVAIIHNQPSHLRQPSDVDCWASDDGGRTWVKRGTPAPRDNERVARGNVAAGLAGNGDLVVITSGWANPGGDNNFVMHPVVSRSSDGGYTWAIDENAFPDGWLDVSRVSRSPEGYLIPFGDILQGHDGLLRAAFYCNWNPGGTFIFYSSDDGRTWRREKMPMSQDAVIQEPAIFHLGGGRWLNAARFNGLDLYTSDDDARTWTRQKELTGKSQHPGHLMRLEDGRILLTYGNRQVPRGVDVRFSDDKGKNWSDPFRVTDFEGDGGYPSTVQLPDGQLLTAYYAQGVEGHNRYHMGVVFWDPERTLR